MKLLAIAVWALGLLAATNAQCARVRKNWIAMSAQEKATYKGAVQASMDSGAYLRFIEMHTEMMSEMEAHGQCMFIYWHRMLVLVFENMLRGQGAQFACVSVPYWDWITDHSRYLSGQCRTVTGCSSLLTELGGVPGGMAQSKMVLNGYIVQGFCVKASPLDHFCESATSCSRCVPRGNWNAVKPPGTTSYASVMSQLFSASSIGQMSPQLERGAHGSIHADFDGAMSTLLSPADPIFWSHHSMIDLLHVIFHKCKVGTTPLTFQQKAAHPVAWSSCGRRNGGAFNPTDVITMRTGGGGSGRAALTASQDPIIGRFFQGVPNRFADLMDTRDLGAFSYSYELSGVTSTLYSQCDGRTATAPQPATAPVPQPASVGTVPSSPAITVVQPASTSWSFNSPSRLRRFLRAATTFLGIDLGGSTATVRAADAATDGESRSGANPAKQVAPPASAATPSPAAALTLSPALASAAATMSTKQVAPPTPASPSAATPPPPLTDAVTIKDATPDPAVQKVGEWYGDMVTAVGGPSPKALGEVERMMCVYQDACLGGVKDFSPEFKKTWGVGSARCKAIVDDVHSGKTTICVEDWMKTMTKRFGCPISAAPETNSTRTSSSSSSSVNSPVQKSV